MANLSPRLTGLPHLADRATRLGGLPHLSVNVIKIKLEIIWKGELPQLPPCKQALILGNLLIRRVDVYFP